MYMCVLVSRKVFFVIHFSVVVVVVVAPNDVNQSVILWVSFSQSAYG